MAAGAPGGSSSSGRGVATRESITRDEADTVYDNLLYTEFLGHDSLQSRVLSYISPSKPSSTSMPSPAATSAASQSHHFSSPSSISSSSSSSSINPYSLSPVGLPGKHLAKCVKTHRKTPTSPYKVLDAPCLQDDFYLNLLDWSSSNILAVGLGNSVYLWNATTSSVNRLSGYRDQYVCSLNWNSAGTHLAIGTLSGTVEVWDVESNKKVFTNNDHVNRVACLAWSGTSLASGSRDRSIMLFDVRDSSKCATLSSHSQEVCGLKYSLDGSQLASGGNDNKLFVWDPIRKSQPLLRFTKHTAAVKAIAWSPHSKGLLASGGGTADRCIRFWNTGTSSHLGDVDTGSQVSNLHWSANANEIVSTHGYSQNAIIIWSYPTMESLATLTGHTFRVLYLSVSPDGETIVTGAGDETLRFWHAFPPRERGPTRRSLVEPSPTLDIR